MRLFDHYRLFGKETSGILADKSRFDPSSAILLLHQIHNPLVRTFVRSRPEGEESYMWNIFLDWCVLLAEIPFKREVTSIFTAHFSLCFQRCMQLDHKRCVSSSFRFCLQPCIWVTTSSASQFFLDLVCNDASGRQQDLTHNFLGFVCNHASG